MEPIYGNDTDDAGISLIDLNLPQVEDPGRPLEAVLAIRVAEGSGRPVERKLTEALVPAAAMIGVKPLFDGVAGEGSDAPSN